jgi:cbb3-type cytochrome oxidase subunit 1
MQSILIKPDAIGSLASTLCLIHCIATPFIFITQACTMSCCSDAPIWWQSIDYIFLIVSFFAIYRSTQTSTKLEIKIALWLTWIVFFILILNKPMQIFYVSNNFTYAAAILLAILHLYNLKYCQCSNKDCCTSK